MKWKTGSRVKAITNYELRIKNCGMAGGRWQAGDSTFQIQDFKRGEDRRAAGDRSQRPEGGKQKEVGSRE
jgi:hypothetical protein